MRPTVQHSFERIVVSQLKLESFHLKSQSLLIYFFKYILLLIVMFLVFCGQIYPCKLPLKAQKLRGSYILKLARQEMIEKENCINLESSLAMVAPKACLMIHSVVGCELVDQVHRLFACGAFCCCSLECHFFLPFFYLFQDLVTNKERQTTHTIVKEIAQ